MGRAERPVDGVITRAGGEVLPGEQSGDEEHGSEGNACGRDAYPDRHDLGEPLRGTQRPREQVRAEPGEDPERDRGGEILERDRRGAGDAQEGRGSVDGDEREVAAGRRDEGGTEHVPREVVVVGDFQSEHRAGGRCLEDGGDPGRGASDE